MAKWTVFSSRFILGFIFILAGLNGLIVFFGMEPFMPTSEEAMEFFTMRYLLFFEKSVEVILGILLIWGRFVPLALVGLSPIIANILAFHLFVDSSFLPLAIILTFLEVYLLWIFREYYTSLLTYKTIQNTKRDRHLNR